MGTVDARDKVTLQTNPRARSRSTREIDERFPRFARQAGERIAGQRRELIGERAEVADDLRRELDQQRQETRSDLHAREPRVGVRWIAREGEVVAGKMCVDVGARRVDQRADERPVFRARRQDGEARGARAAKQAQEEGLGAIAGVVRRRDDRGAGARGGGEESVVARVARARLKVAARLHDDARARERDAEATREALGEIELGGRLGPQAVVDAVRDERVAELIAEEREDVEERDRVGAAAHGDEHARAAGETRRAEERVRLDRSAREGEERRRVRPHDSSNSLQNVTRGAPRRCAALG